MSLLPPLSLPLGVSPGQSSASPPASSASGTTSPSGRVTGPDIVTQVEPVTPSRIMLDLRQTRAELLTSPDLVTLRAQEAARRYVAARKVGPT